jgi:D-glycero-D-manno-heptose 1,7-bisphosphate phosphatase
MDMSQAVILVGGAGTRLGGLSARAPKPLLMVGDRPFLSSLIRQIARFGVRRFLLIAGHIGDKVAAFVADKPGLSDLAIDIECMIEPRPQGTGGALRFAAERLDGAFLAFNGDSRFDVDLVHFWRAAEQRLKGAGRVQVVVALRSEPEPSRYGVVELAGDPITGFAERPPVAKSVAGDSAGGEERTFSVAYINAWYLCRRSIAGARGSHTLVTRARYTAAALSDRSDRWLARRRILH